MKLHKIFFILVFLLTSFQICSGQKKPENLTVVDSLVEPNCELLLSRMDNLLAETYKKSSSAAYIIIQGSNPIQNKFYETSVRNYSKFRRFDDNHFAIVAINSDGKLKVDLAISKDGIIKDDKRASEFSYTIPASGKPMKFGGETGEVVKIEGKLTFIGSCADCCIASANFNLLSKFLESNPHLNASIKIFSKTRKRAKQLEKLLRDEAINDYKIPANRLKIIYGGVDEGISQLAENISSIEINLIAVE